VVALSWRAGDAPAGTWLLVEATLNQAVELGPGIDEVTLRTLTGQVYRLDHASKSPPQASSNARSSAQPLDVFMSYSRVDSELADRLTRDLASAGLSIWLERDQALATVGSNRDYVVERALMDARAVLVLLSPESVQSVFVRNEIMESLKLMKHIIPVIIADGEVPLAIRNRHFVDLRSDYAKGLDLIVKSLRAYATDRP